MYQCRECCKVVLRRKCKRENHKCGAVTCPSCKEQVIPLDHQCFLKRVDHKLPSDKLIFFDFETDQSSGEHVVNFAVAQYRNGDEVVFKGYNACEDFCVWLFSRKHQGYTAIAHNMKG